MIANLDFSTLGRPSTVLTVLKKHTFYESLKACFLNFCFFVSEAPLGVASLDIRSQINGRK